MPLITRMSFVNESHDLLIEMDSKEWGITLTLSRSDVDAILDNIGKDDSDYFSGGKFFGTNVWWAPDQIDGINAIAISVGPSREEVGFGVNLIGEDAAEFLKKLKSFAW